MNRIPEDHFLNELKKRPGLKPREEFKNELSQRLQTIHERNHVIKLFYQYGRLVAVAVAFLFFLNVVDVGTIIQNLSDELENLVSSSAELSQQVAPTEAAEKTFNPEKGEFQTMGSAVAPGPVPDLKMEGFDLVVNKVMDYLKADASAMLFAIHDPSYNASCQRATSGVGTLPDEANPVFSCSIGKALDVINAHVIIWVENGKWTYQAYPQAESGTEERYNYFSNLALNSPNDYGSDFTNLRIDGNRMLAVVNLTAVDETYTEEVQFLEKVNGVWKVLWVPNPKEYFTSEESGNIFVTLPKTGIASFTVGYPDGTNTTWKKEGNEYKKE